MCKAQKANYCTNEPSSQTFRSESVYVYLCVSSRDPIRHQYVSGLPPFKAGFTFLTADEGNILSSRSAET
jgi:hypothetical protein